MTETQSAGNIRITDRKMIALSGITAVDRFDDTTICLDSTLGALSVEGEELHITTLDLERGIVEACGRIDAVYFAADTPKNIRRGLFGRAR